MPSTPIRRALVLVTSGALLSALAVTSVAAPVAAAKPKCQGVTATIVGTKKADVIIGTAKRDVIVAKGGADRIFGRGGNDLICAGAGNDRVVGNAGIDKLIAGAGSDKLFGGPGPDRLFGGPGTDTLAGQPGNDVLDGGLGVDTCYQGIGTGPIVRCELPVAPVAPPAPVPAPTPPPGPACTYDFVTDLPSYDASGSSANYLPSIEEPDSADDVICGGPGRDVISNMEGGFFYGNGGQDEVDDFEAGTFYGGDDNDHVSYLFGPNAVFYGEGGNDTVGELEIWADATGTFIGGPGNDTIELMEAGHFDGGAGDNEIVEHCGGTYANVASVGACTSP